MVEASTGVRPRPSLRRRSGAIFGTAAVLVVAVAIVSVVFLKLADHDRARLLDRLDPSIEQLNAYGDALVSESSGARGFALTGSSGFAATYRSGTAAARAALTGLSHHLPDDAMLRGELQDLVAVVSGWQHHYLLPELAGPTPGRPIAASLAGSTVAFTQIRHQITSIGATIAARRASAVAGFNRAMAVLEIVVGTTLAAAAALIAFLWLALRRTVLRPLLAVGDDSRRVTSGDLDHEVAQVGPAEVADLAEAIDAMRAAVVHDIHALEVAHAELAAQERQLAERGEELSRSNRDLEQFAYVASHDLQEPLRKVASFCQLLSDRYGGQLDDRADQYIDFAVDGAKRMQALVNDLLAFSRVGRNRDRWTRVDLDVALAAALANLDRRIREAGGTVSVEGPLPTVDGDLSLLTALLANLIGNSIKFRGEEPPSVVISCRRAPDGGGWDLRVRDNGIGIEPEYAERVFTIFQRLHTRDRYEGTGIGLALVRRIVEFHGGTVEVDTDDPPPGATIRLTLPAAAKPATIEETDVHQLATTGDTEVTAADA